MVISRGTGRKDYSQNVETSVVPIIRSHQQRIFYTLSFSLPSFSYVDLVVPLTSGGFSMFYNFFLSASSNELIELSVYYENGLVTDKMGYQVVDLPFLQGFPFAELTIRVINYGTDISDLYLSAAGLFAPTWSTA